MKNKMRGDICSSIGSARSLTQCSLLLFAVTSCGGTDDRFQASSDDEYTEPLTDVVIGTPETMAAARAAAESSGAQLGTLAVGSGGGGSVGTGGAIGVAGKGSAGSVGSGGLAGQGGGFSSGGQVNQGGEAGTFGGGDGQGSGFGSWSFDDCAPNSNFLLDSSGNGANAQHALQSSCVPGISGSGVQFRTQKDIVQIPDEPQFTVESRVAVAAWVNPTTTAGDQPIVIKRLNNKTAFSLGIHKGNIEMSVVLSTGKTFISRAPIAAGTFSHVAGLYDGRFLFLFLNGEQVGQVAAAGTLRNVFAPIRIGATTQSQHFTGIIDEVFLSTDPISKDELSGLSCVHRPTTFSVTPPSSGPVPPGTTVHYDIAIKNNDLGLCQPTVYESFFNFSDPNIQVNPGFFFDFVQPGATAIFGTNVSSTEEADPGLHQLGFFIESFGRSFEFLQGQLNYELAEPTGCFVRTRRELMVTSTSVVDDPIRTSFGFDGSGGEPGGFAGAPDTPGSGGGFGSGSGGFGGIRGASGATGSGGNAGGPDNPFPDGGADSPSRGVWTFGRLMRDLAPTPEAAPAMVEQLFQHWLTDQTVNGFIVRARPLMQQVLLDIWPRTPNGELDLDRSPLRLQAIANRMDLQNLALHSAGEGRFVFGVNDFFGGPQEFTVIVEYNLPAETAADVSDWASRWHALSDHPFPSEEYNAALEAVTLRFTGRGSSPGRVNDSANFRVRTNEIRLAQDGRWELREFELSRDTGFFHETTIKLTPDLGFNFTPTLADFVNQNEAAIIAETSTVPEQFEGQPFLGGSVFNDLIIWQAPGIRNNEARFHLSVNTCNGCHGPETNTSFLQVSPRSPGQEASLSPFLTGTTVFDQVTGEPRTLNELGRRNGLLKAQVCSTSTTP